MKRYIKVLLFIYLTLIIEGQLTAQFYMQGGFSKHIKNKELNSFGYYESLLN